MLNMKLLPPHYSIPVQTDLLPQILPFHSTQKLFVVEHPLDFFSTSSAVPFVGLSHVPLSLLLISCWGNLCIDVLPVRVTGAQDFRRILS